MKHVLRGFALVVTDRRWAASLSAAALGFGIFAGVAIGPGAAGTLATGARQIVEIPASSEQSGEGGGAVASAESAPPPKAGESFEEAIPSSVPLAPQPVESVPEAAPEPAPKPARAGGEEEEAEEEGETQILEGTVVHANPAAGSYALAIAGGELVAIHAPDLPEPGAKLDVPVRRLANGTFAEAGEAEKERQRATRVELRGAVTFVDPDPAAPAYTVSGRGPSLLVHVEPDPTGAVPDLPAIGAYVAVTVTLEAPAEPEAGPSLLQDRVEVEPGPPSTYLELAGIVEEVLADGHLLLSADDAGDSGADLSLAVPAAIDASKLEPGDSHLATATVETDGSLTLAGIAGDEHTRGADDSTLAQGDLRR